MPEKTKNSDVKAAPVPTWLWILLLVLAIGAYFSGLNIPLVGPDEPRYAQVAREMFLRGDIVTPTLGGYHWFEKPALLYWLQVASYSFFGVSEFSARLGSALFGIGTAASLWILGRFTPFEDLGRWLALICSSTLGLIVFAHGATFDIILTLPITAALASFYVFDRRRSQGISSSLPLLLFYFFVGVSLLAKGLIGILFPFAIVGLYHTVSWRLPSRTLALSFFWGTLLAVAVSATWYMPMYTRHGYGFVDEFFLQHHFQRFTSNKFQHPQPFYFFFWVLPLMTIPWLPFFGAAVVSRVRDLFPSRGMPASRDPATALRNFAWAWLLVPLGFFSVSGSKLPGYILPAVPAAALIISLYLFPQLQRSVRWRNLVISLAALTFALVIISGWLIAPVIAEKESVRSLIAAADGRGYTSEPVLMYLRISHNAEFYGAGRLVRDNDGKLYRVSSKEELMSELGAHGGRALVLVPREYISQLTDAPDLETEMLGSNGEFDIALVNARH